MLILHDNTYPVQIILFKMLVFYLVVFFAMYRAARTVASCWTRWSFAACTEWCLAALPCCR